MPQPSDLRPIEIAGIAAAAGIGWGIVMALVAWVRDGTEIVLLQAFYLAPAWFFGRAAGGPRMGALAGFALVLAAIYTFELLPMWGLETALRREALAEGLPLEQADVVAAGFDRQDIALFSTVAIGTLVGLAGGLQAKASPAAAAAAAPAPAAAPPPEPPSAAPEPLWSGYGRPQAGPPAPDPLLSPPPTPSPPPAPRVRRTTPWGSAFLAAAFATDLWLERLFEAYTDAQAGVATGFVLLGALATAWFARRYTLFMVVAGLVLAAGFAAVQDAEYDARHDPVAIVR